MCTLYTAVSPWLYGLVRFLSNIPQGGGVLAGSSQWGWRGGGGGGGGVEGGVKDRYSSYCGRKIESRPPPHPPPLLPSVTPASTHYFSSVTAGADFNPLLIRCGEPVAENPLPAENPELLSLVPKSLNDKRVHGSCVKVEVAVLGSPS